MGPLARRVTAISASTFSCSLSRTPSPCLPSPPRQDIVIPAIIPTRGFYETPLNPANSRKAKEGRDLQDVFTGTLFFAVRPGVHENGGVLVPGATSGSRVQRTTRHRDTACVRPEDPWLRLSSYCRSGLRWGISTEPNRLGLGVGVRAQKRQRIDGRTDSRL
jgi:hypothetical protein